MKSPNILAIGGAHVDRRGQVSGVYVPGASNPGTMREDVGGGVFNALRNAVRRGAAASLMSVRGGDAAGDMVARAIAEEGILDLSAVFLDRTTPSYTAILDRDGDVITGFADMMLYELALPKQMRRSKMREAVAGAEAVLCDANLPAEALRGLLGLAAGKPVFVIAVSPAKVVRLHGLLSGLACLFMNRREIRALAETGGSDIAASIKVLRERGLVRGVVTAGESAVIGFDGDQVFSIAPPPARKVVDVTGAGDALAGATTVAMLRGLPLREALREGVAAAVLAVESDKSVPDLSPQEFAAVLSLVPDARELHEGAQTGDQS